MSKLPSLLCFDLLTMLPRALQSLTAAVAMVCILAAGTAEAAGATSAVALTGILGSKALLVVNGTAPRVLATGERYLGVTLVSVGREDAVVELDGARHTVRLGEAPVSVGARGGSVQRVLLAGDGQGHFAGAGQINGRAMQFLIDTGATTVALGALEADRLGLRYKEGDKVRMQTANGVVQGWRVRLEAVRVGELQVQGVDAVVLPHALPHVLLGNSFLRGLQMSRNNEQMVLEKRP